MAAVSATIAGFALGSVAAQHATYSSQACRGSAAMVDCVHGLWTQLPLARLGMRALFSKGSRRLQNQSPPSLLQHHGKTRVRRMSASAHLGEIPGGVDVIHAHVELAHNMLANLQGTIITLANAGASADGAIEAAGVKRNSSGSNFSITQIWQQDSLLFNKQGAMGTLAVMILVFQMCPEAWAGTEVARINLNSGLFELSDWSDIQSGFTKAFLLILFSEIGDKTFFIAALLATRKSSVAVFSGTFGALMAMTVISVCLGRAFHYIDGILPSFGDTKLPVDDIAAVILLIYFGVSTLIDAVNMEDSNSGEEQQEAELAIASAGAGGAVAGTVAATFALVFVAEWGDKSFFSTIALAAASSPLGVVSGAIAGHGAATLLAVLGGSFLGNYVSEKVIAYAGGVLFLVFAGVTVVEILN